MVMVLALGVYGQTSGSKPEEVEEDGVLYFYQHKWCVALTAATTGSRKRARARWKVFLAHPVTKEQKDRGKEKDKKRERYET